jgi:hypothetical protein
MDFVRLVEEGMAISFVKKKGAHLFGEELKNAMIKILDHSRKSAVATNTNGPLWALIEKDLGSAARLGFYDIIVDYQGQLKVSSRTSPRVGHILHDDIWTVLAQNPILQSLRLGKIEGCSACDVFKAGRCSGDRNIAFAATGSFLGPDVGCWKWRSENEPLQNFNGRSGSSNLAWRRKHHHVA